MLHHIRKQINHSMRGFLKKSQSRYDFNLIGPSLGDGIQDFCLRKGKRIRPLLFVLSYQGYSKGSKTIPRSVYEASIAMELLHNFMLIHDDIIDRSDLRRGKPTLHILLGRSNKTKKQKKLGYDLGIVSGDIVYALAIDAFLNIQCPASRKEEALKYFVRTAIWTAMGEFFDTANGVKGIDKVSEKDVFLNYTLKTAHYTFDAPLRIGAVLAGAPQSDLKKLSQCGIHMGQAFQIQDDLLGIFGSEQKIGKSILSDLAEAKKTLLVSHAFSRLRGKKRKEFVRVFSKPKKTFKDLQAMRKIMITTGSLDYCVKQIDKRLKQSERILNGLTIKNAYRQLIKDALLTLFRYTQEIATTV